MPEPYLSLRTVLLPRRLPDHVPALDDGGDDTPAASRPRTWGLYRRIEALPGVLLQQRNDAANVLASDYYIDNSYVLRSAGSDPYLLCHIDGDGILLPMISSRAKDEVLRKGWATDADDAVTMYLPRDSIEMEIAWRIVLMAYQFQTSPPPRTRNSARAEPAAPHGSSTSRYWM